jgi:hypothetical protein
MSYTDLHPGLRQGEYLMCRRCHETVSPKWRRCPNCGADLSELPDAAPSGGVEHVVTEYPPAQPERRLGKRGGAGCVWFPLVSILPAIVAYLLMVGFGSAALALPVALAVAALGFIGEALYLRRAHGPSRGSERLAS